MIVAESDHGDISNFDATELVAFFDEHRERRLTRAAWLYWTRHIRPAVQSIPIQGSPYVYSDMTGG